MRAILLAAGIAAVGILAGCSSSPPAEQSTTSVTPTGHGSLAHCLSEHGVPVAPGPAVGPPSGVSQETWSRAMQACSMLGPRARLLDQAGRVARVGQPIVFQAGQCPVVTQIVDDRRHAPGQ